MQVAQRKQRDELLSALRQSAIAKLRIAELPLQNPERMLAYRTQPGNRMVESARPGIRDLLGLALRATRSSIRFSSSRAWICG
jgi:hypothetical protein